MDSRHEATSMSKVASDFVIPMTESDWPATEAERVALLEIEAFATETQYDALGRVAMRETADNPGGTGSTIRPRYLAACVGTFIHKTAP